MAQQPRDIAGDEIGTQRPTGIDITETDGKIGQSREHHALVRHRIGNTARRAIDADRHAAERFEPEPGGRDDDIGFEQRARGEADAVRFETLDRVGDDIGLAGLDGAEQIGIRNEAEPLVPGVVAWGEMFAHVIAFGQQLLEPAEQIGADFFGMLAGLIVEPHAEGDVFPADDVIGELRRQEAAQDIGDRVRARPADHIGGGALQHRHMRCCRGHGRYQRHGGGARADDDDLFAGIIEMFRPELRLDDLAGEIRLARPFGLVALRIAVITRAHVQEVAGEMADAAVLLRCGKRPAGGA